VSGSGVLPAVSLSLVLAACSASDDVGKELYLEYCSSCHGDNLQGQPDWMRRLPSGRLPAPPHDASGHTWHHSDKQLLAVIRDGLETMAPGYETDMPAFAAVLTDTEIMAIIDYIKSTWPERERGYQETLNGTSGE
jgi:mono/diheme cytochrome c family protein|tara:strand:- start:354 stop:761 length:408 start_codon:yes stop_codon:yes gene_type:complete